MRLADFIKNTTNGQKKGIHEMLLASTRVDENGQLIDENDRLILEWLENNKCRLVTL